MNTGIKEFNVIQSNYNKLTNDDRTIIFKLEQLIYLLTFYWTSNAVDQIISHFYLNKLDYNKIGIVVKVEFDNWWKMFEGTFC